MKTTVDIPEDELNQLMKNTKAILKKDAIVQAISEFNRKKRLDKLSKHIGTFENLISLNELLSLRKTSRAK